MAFLSLCKLSNEQQLKVEVLKRDNLYMEKPDSGIIYII